MNRPRARQIAVDQHEPLLVAVLMNQVARGPIGIRRQFGPTRMGRHVTVQRALFENVERRSALGVFTIVCATSVRYGGSALVLFSDAMSGVISNGNRSELLRVAPASQIVMFDARAGKRRNRTVTNKDCGVIRDSGCANHVEHVFERHIHALVAVSVGADVEIDAEERMRRLPLPSWAPSRGASRAPMRPSASSRREGPALAPRQNAARRRSTSPLKRCAEQRRSQGGGAGAGPAVMA